MIAPPVPVVAGANTIYTFAAAVTPATAVITSYAWKFGDGSADQTTTGGQVTHSFRNGGGPYTIQVFVTSSTGQTADTFIVINP
jgi:PKD repeat protein